RNTAYITDSSTNQPCIGREKSQTKQNDKETGEEENKQTQPGHATHARIQSHIAKFDSKKRRYSKDPYKPGCGCSEIRRGSPTGEVGDP
ncbi:hypothetical protein OB937_00005, partial [Bifidobacterium catenulatum subsp. kashiwanohense]